MEKFFKIIFRSVTAFIIIVSFTMMPASAESSPKLNKTSTELSIGYYTTLKVTGCRGDVEWSSKNSEVAAVKSTEGNTAKISGKKTGNTYIYAKTDGKTLKCKVTVRQSFISVTKDTIELDKGQSETIFVTVRGNREIVLDNSDSDIAEVSWWGWKGKSTALTIDAKSEGTAELEIYTDGYKSSTKKTITVQVIEPDAGYCRQMSDQVIELVNKEREAAGLSPLKKDDKLTAAAELRAHEIIENFSHTRPDGTKHFTVLKEVGLSSSYAGENIARGQRDAEAVMTAWMDSEGHKENILDEKYTRTGVFCVVVRATRYWVQVFAK